MHHARLPEIDGIALKAAREKLGMERAEVASHCCLSSKMIIELEEGGISSFYNFQLKVSAAKKVGTYLGLKAEDFLQQPAEAVENDSPQIAGESLSEHHDSDLVKTSATQSLSGEVGQLDDLIYESTNSGTSLPHVSSRPRQVRWMNVSAFVLLGFAAIYVAENWFHVSNKAIVFLGQGDNKKVELPEPPKDVATQDEKSMQEDEKSSSKADPKVESVATPAVTQNQCSPVREDQLLVYKSPNPSKSGDAVNIKTLVKQVLCVTDSQGKQVLVELEPNTAHSFRGTPPFVVTAQDLDNVEMFYQGWRVRPPNAGMKQMRLVEVAMQ